MAFLSVSSVFQRTLPPALGERFAGTCRARLNLAYGLWVLLQLPVLLAIYDMMEAWDIYRVAFLAIALSWGAAHRCEGGDRQPRQPIRYGRCLLGAVVGVGSLGMLPNLFLASLLSIVTFLLLRTGLTGERAVQAFRAGGVVLLFAIALPLPLLEGIAGMLTEFHLALCVPLLEHLTGCEAVVRNHSIFYTEDHGGTFIRECAGVTSLYGAVTFATYFSVTRKLGFALGGLLCVLAVVLAVVCNAARVVGTGIFIMAEWTFWSGPVGHTWFGFLMLALCIAMLSGCAGAMVKSEFSDERAAGLMPLKLTTRTYRTIKEVVHARIR